MNQRMPDPFGSMRGLMNQFNQFMRNPMQVIGQRIPGLNVSPQSNPNEVIQSLMNSGRMSQSQYNFYNQLAQRIQSFGQQN